MTKRVLNVGGGNKKVAIPPYYGNWEHLLLDIDPVVSPDVCMDARELSSLPAEQYDAIYCSHNLEHYFSHDVQRVLSGFSHVLKSDGFAEVRVPDIGAVMREVVEKNLDIDDVLYNSGMGPILVKDVLYGYGKQIEESGVDFYAHKTGFTRKSLANAFKRSGFTVVVSVPGRNREIAFIGFKQTPNDSQCDIFKIPKVTVELS